MTGRPFFVAVRRATLRAARGAALGAALGLTAFAASAPLAAAEALIASGPGGAQRIEVLDCRTGATRAGVALHGPLAVDVAADFGAGVLYAATRTPELLRYTLPGLRLTARTALPLVPTALAVPADRDAIVLVGGRSGGGDGSDSDSGSGSGTDSGSGVPLLAYDAGTLEVLARYPVAQRSVTVSSIVDIARRRRLVVAFSDLNELWEIAYAHDAPPVLRGLVHDYRSKEAVPLPGRLTPRPFEVPTPSRALAPGPNAFELLRIDARGTLGVVNLEVRREIERPAIAGTLEAGRIAPWGTTTGRGWLIATAEGAALRLESPSWRLAAVELGGRATALAGGTDAAQLFGVIEVEVAGEGIAAPTTSLGATPRSAKQSGAVPSESAMAVRVDANHWQVERLGRLALSAHTVARIATASDGICVAALDAQGRWLARLERS